RLGYRNDLDVDRDPEKTRDPAWCFTLKAADNAAAGETTACTMTHVSPGDWVHLTGVVDPLSNQVRLYVNGIPTSRGTRVIVGGKAAWPATGGFAIGRGGIAASPAERWVGDIDEVYAVPRVWTDEEIEWHADPPESETGNKAPRVDVSLPQSGQLFSPGDTVPFKVAVSDPQEASIDCAKVKVTYRAGRDKHAVSTANGCTGQVTIPDNAGHNAAANVYAGFDAEYTDSGADGQPALTTHTVQILQPRARQAEFFSDQLGAWAEDRPSASGGQAVAYIEDRTWISFAPVNLANATSFTARVSSGGVGGNIEVRAGSPAGTLLGTANVPVTGGWDTYTEVATTLAGAPADESTLFLVFTGPTGFLFNLDEYWITTLGTGAPVEGEAFSTQSGVAPAGHATASGGRTLGFVEGGDWAGYASVSTENARAFSAKVSSETAGGTIEIRSGSATGTLLGSVTVPPTGGWENFVAVSTLLTPAGPGPLFLRFTGAGLALFDLDSFALTTDSGATGPIVGKGGRCVGVHGGRSEPGTPIVWAACEQNPDQKWTVHANGTVRSMGKCLDVANFKVDSGSPVHLWNCSTPPTSNQQWVAQLDGRLKNPVSGRCLDGDNLTVTMRLWDCHGGANQRWQLPTATSARNDPPNRPFLVRNVATGRCLDLPGYGPGRPSQPVLQYACNNTPGDNQLWFFDDRGRTADGQVLYSVRNAKDGLCLDVPDYGAAPPGSRVSQYHCGGPYDNQFVRQVQRNGGVWLVNDKSGLCLDVVGVNVNDAPLSLYHCSDTDDHIWTLEFAE
ncbi:MAG TPA: carbohydrate-binding protein, partial [Catenuloplanes sp.]